MAMPVVCGPLKRPQATANYEWLHPPIPPIPSVSLLRAFVAVITGGTQNCRLTAWTVIDNVRTLLYI